MRGFGLTFMTYHREPSTVLLVVNRCLWSLMMMLCAFICTYVVAVVMCNMLEFNERIALLSAAIFGAVFWGLSLFMIWTGRLERHEYQQ